MSSIPSVYDRPAISQRRVLVIIGGLLLGMVLASLDQTIVATALPTIAGDLHGLSHLSWVVTGYLLASTASTPLWGKLGDLYGRKSFFQAAIVIFLVTSSGRTSSLLAHGESAVNALAGGFRLAFIIAGSCVAVAIVVTAVLVHSRVENTAAPSGEPAAELVEV